MKEVNITLKGWLKVLLKKDLFPEKVHNHLLFLACVNLSVTQSGLTSDEQKKLWVLPPPHVTGNYFTTGPLPHTAWKLPTQALSSSTATNLT